MRETTIISITDSIISHGDEKMIDIEKYRALQREANSLYQEEKYQEVIDFLEKVANQFPDLKAAIYYSRLCAAVKLEKYELFFKFFSEILNEGGWYSETVLRQSPSLKPLQDMPEFKKLLKISKERSMEASKNSNDLTVFPENINAPYPLMLALHSDGPINDEYEAWKTVVDRGYVLGMPYSRTVYWSGKDSAYWHAAEPATNQIKAYLNELNQNKLLDLERSLIGGLSMGGGVALRLALTGIVTVHGFVVAAPGGLGLDEPETWQPLIDEAKGRDLRGIITWGEEDKAITRESLQKLTKMLNDGGIPTKFIEYPGLGHWYPRDFTKILDSLIVNRN